MTLGWVYQFWNDPEREEIDKKLDAGGKVEPYEIASKTQMFTERYMVDWLLQNSLGPMWLAMCRKHGWTPEVQADGTLDRLEERRAQWRAQREAGEVSLTELMPLDTDAERHWAYYVPQPIPDDAVQHAPESVRGLNFSTRHSARGISMWWPSICWLPSTARRPGTGGARRRRMVRPSDCRAYPGAQSLWARPGPTGGTDRGSGVMAQGKANVSRGAPTASQPCGIEPAAGRSARR